MPRDWHPLRFFAREDGRPRPTILFWLFFVPGLTIVLAGCYLILDRRGDQAAVTSVLTGTPAAETRMSMPTETLTPSTPTSMPETTESVYDDPTDWQFIERTDPTGKTYLDLQDWQKEQVWHAFEQYWNLWYRSEDGLTPYEDVEAYITGSFAEGVKSGYDTSKELGQYVYLVQPLDEVQRAMILESAEGSNIRVKIVLVSDFGFPLERRDIDTGVVVEADRRFSYKTWTFFVTYQAGRWVIEDTSIEELE